MKPIIEYINEYISNPFNCYILQQSLDKNVILKSLKIHYNEKLNDRNIKLIKTIFDDNTIINKIKELEKRRGHTGVYFNFIRYKKEIEKRIKILEDFDIFIKYYKQYLSFDDSKQNLLIFNETVKIKNYFVFDKFYHSKILNDKDEYEIINDILNGEFDINKFINLIKQKNIELKPIELETDLNFKVDCMKYDSDFKKLDESIELEKYNENELTKISKLSDKYLRSYLLGLILNDDYGICSDENCVSSFCSLISEIISNLDLDDYIEPCNCGNGSCCHFLNTDKIINYIFMDNVVYSNTCGTIYYYVINEREFTSYDKIIKRIK